MNESIKKKINGLGRAGMIIAIIFLISTVFTATYYLYHLFLLPIHNTAAMLPGQYAVLMNIISRLIGIAATVINLLFLIKVANAFRRCDTPFEKPVIRKMTVLAWVLLGIAVLTRIVSAVINFKMQAHLETPLSQIAVFQASALLSPDFTILTALALLFLTRVFRHGAQLQKEVDETL